MPFLVSLTRFALYSLCSLILRCLPDSANGRSRSLSSLNIFNCLLRLPPDSHHLPTLVQLPSGPTYLSTMSGYQGQKDGRGGAVYYANITITTYPDGLYGGQTFNSSYWAMDFDWQFSLRVNCAVAVCFGLLFMTFVQVLALTPSSKRGLPLFTFSLAAIAFELTRYFLLMILYTWSGWISAYVIITGDQVGAHYSRSTTAMSIASQIVAPISYLFIQFCLFIQAKAVLSAIQITHRLLHTIIMCLLIILGAVSLGWRIFVTVIDIWQSIDYYHWVRPWASLVADALYAASLGSWSLVFTIQVGIILYRRARMGGRLQRTEALNILMLTSIESMVLPSECSAPDSPRIFHLPYSHVTLFTDQIFSVLFAILQFLPTAWLVEPGLLILPAVCILIPFGSLWASSMQTYDKSKHTFTRSFLEHDTRTTCVDSEQSSTGNSHQRKVHGAARHGSNEDGEDASTARTNSVCDTAPLSGRRRGSQRISSRGSTGSAKHKPMGLLDALAQGDEDEDEEERYEYGFDAEQGVELRAEPGRRRLFQDRLKRQTGMM